MLANSRVTLLWTCKTERGWRRYPVVINKRGQVRKGIVLVDGQEREFPNGRFELRLYEGDRPVIKNVGTDPAEAQLAQERETNLLAAQNAAAVAGIDLDLQSERKSLAELKEQFLTEKALEPHRSADAGATYRVVLDEFLDVCTQTYPEQIQAVDVLRYCDGLEERGLSARTRANRFTALKTFLHFCGVNPKDVLSREQLKKLKKFTRKEVQVYTREEIDTLIARTPKEGYRLLWEFLFKTGFRMAEAMHLEWVDIDFENKTVSVRAKPHWGFAPKDSEERSVPLVNGLGDKLRAWREKSPKTRLVFGTRSDLPNNKMLPKLKKCARIAGLNCGRCPTCVAKGECERFWLHKFRASYATTLLQNGVDVRTVQKLLGHSDLESTLRYLQPAKGQVVQDKVNAAFAASAQSALRPTPGRLRASVASTQPLGRRPRVQPNQRADTEGRQSSGLDELIEMTRGALKQFGQLLYRPRALSVFDDVYEVCHLCLVLGWQETPSSYSTFPTSVRNLGRKLPVFRSRR